MEKTPEKKPPQKPTNLRIYACDLWVNDKHLTKLEISPYYEKHNREYLESLERKRIKLTAMELSEKLITDDLIRKTLLPQLNKEEEIRIDGEYYDYDYYFAITYKGIKAYKLVWCLTDKEPNVLGLMDCYRQRKFDKKEQQNS